MYLFTRTGRFRPGGVRKAMAFVGDVTEKARQETGLDVHAWTASLSPELGGVVWSTFVDDLAHLEEANDKLATSDSFNDLSDRGAELFVGPLSDMAGQVVAGEVDPSAQRPSYVNVAQSVAANGKLRAAIDGGVEIAEAVGRLTGLQTMFIVGITGPYGGCAWTTGAADLGEIERAQAALMADDGWLDLVDRVGPAYEPGASQSIYRRIT